MDTVSALVKDAVLAFRKHFSALFGLGVVLYLIPVMVIELINVLVTGPLTERFIMQYEESEITWQLFVGNFGWLSGVYAILIIIVVLLALYLAFCVVRTLDNKKAVDWREALEIGKEGYGRGLGLSITMFIFLSFLYLLFFIPGLIFSIFWTFAMYFVILEKKGVLDALRASKALVQGRWWMTFALLLLLSLIIVGANMGATPFQMFISLSVGPIPYLGDLLVALVANVVQMFLTLFSVVFSYHLFRYYQTTPVRK